MTNKDYVNVDYPLSDSARLAIQIMVHYHIPFSFDTINRFDKEIAQAFQGEDK